jgi:hypothetical protein
LFDSMFVTGAPKKFLNSPVTPNQMLLPGSLVRGVRILLRVVGNSPCLNQARGKQYSISAGLYRMFPP